MSLASWKNWASGAGQPVAAFPFPSHGVAKQRVTRMKNKKPCSSGVEDRRDLVAQAERQLWAAGTALDDMIADIRAGKLGAAKDLSAAVAGLRKGLEAVFSERAKLEKFESEHGDIAGELDLESARAEVRSRLDRLRASNAAGGFSDRAE